MDDKELALIVDADCGVYDWMCCLGFSDMARLLTIYDNLGRTRFLNLYRYICMCRKKPPPPPPDEKKPNPPIIEPPDRKVEGCALPPKRAPK